MATVEVGRHERNVAMRRRYDALRGGGYRWGAALRLAASREVDVRMALDLLRRGCPQETAIRILL